MVSRALFPLPVVGSARGFRVPRGTSEPSVTNRSSRKAAVAALLSAAAPSPERTTTTACAQLPAPSQAAPPPWLQDVPLAFGVVEGTPELHAPVAHWLDAG